MTRSARAGGPWPRWGFLVGFAVVLTAVVAWWLLHPRTELTPYVKPARVTGQDVTVTYIGGTCQQGAHLDIDEDTEQVVLTVRTWTRVDSCDDAGVGYTLTGRLGAELGSREVVDGACEVPKYARYGDCRQP